MSKAPNAKPFATLGDKLKSLRQRHKESLAEAAGAVEITEEELVHIEQGYTRPSEEILLLLINHFDTPEADALRLWELAGYDADDKTGRGDDIDAPAKMTIMAVTFDPRIVYSDSVQINGNKHGVVLNFMQPGSGGVPSLPAARVGMSRDQAKHMLRVLHDTLAQLDSLNAPKQLPPHTKRETP